MKITWNLHFRVRDKFSVIIEKLMHKLIFYHKNVKIGNAKIFNTRVVTANSFGVWVLRDYLIPDIVN